MNFILQDPDAPLSEIIQTETKEVVLYQKMTPKRHNPPEYQYEIIFIFDSSCTIADVNSSDTMSELDPSPSMDDINNSCMNVLQKKKNNFKRQNLALQNRHRSFDKE